MRTLLLALLLSSAFYSFSQENKEVNRIMDQRANELLMVSKSYAVSIGIVKDGIVYTKHYGEIDKGKGNTANDNTLFEIASVTKIFTGTLMADAVLEGKLNLDDDIRKYMQGSYPNLEFNGKPITIKDLISFRTALVGGLPNIDAARKVENDSTTFYIQKIDKSYSKQQFFEDLKQVKLDTVPGYNFRYSNLSLELSGHILENVYGKSYQALLSEKILNPLKMNATKLKLEPGETAANGYNQNHVMTASMCNNLWGSGGFLKSTMSDLTKMLSFELDRKNKTVQETQRNIYNSATNFNGYFWDGIEIADNGKFCYKQGGAFGTQTLFAVYPEQNLGICIIVNISAENTYGALMNAISGIAQDMKPENKKQKMAYGYRLTKDNVIFTYSHPKNLDTALIKTIAVAGSFNDWKPQNKQYQLTKASKNTFEVSVPKKQFELKKIYSFKFVINQDNWVASPQNATNVENGEDKNLTFQL